jgi:hypothetical protein
VFPNLNSSELSLNTCKVSRVNVLFPY